MDIFNRICKLISNKCSVSQEWIFPETDLIADLQFDSLNFLEFIVELEKEFGLNIPSEDAIDIQTVGELSDYLKIRLKT